MSDADDVTPDAVPAAPAGSAASLVDSSSAEPEAIPLPLPADAAGWRVLLASVSARDILRAVQEDKERTSHLLMGFRPSADAIRRPVVAERIVQEAMKQPKFAEVLARLAAKPSDPLPLKAALRPSGNPPASKARVSGEESAVLKDTIARQRSMLRDKDARLHDLEEALSVLTRERDVARAELEAAQAARLAAEAKAERQRRQREREARRQTVAPSPKSPRTAAAAIAPPVPPLARPSLSARPFDEAVIRLLNRGKYGVVADLCREALPTEAAADSIARRGQIHAFFAAALYGEGNTAGGEEQDRLAIADLLDGGCLIAAAESMARLATHAAMLRSADVPLLRRLLLLAEKEGQAAAVRDVFTRMRIGAPDAYRRVRQALGASGKKLSSLFGAERESRAAVGPDEAIALPVAQPAAAAVTPRRIVQAVDAGEEDLVAQVREGLNALRQRSPQDATLADAFLEAVATIETVAVAPLLRPETNPIVVDASNVARHTPDPLVLEPSPSVANLRQMRDFLLRDGFFPVLLIADANLRFHVDDRTAYLSLVDRYVVREAPSRISADEVLIREAEARHAPLVTNDRLTEWGEAARRVQRYGFLLLSNRVALMPA
jgi:hypothetical protein